MVIAIVLQLPKAGLASIRKTQSWKAVEEEAVGAAESFGLGEPTSLWRDEFRDGQY